MDEVVEFAKIVLFIAGAFTLAVVSSKVTERVPIPAPAVFLGAAAVASDLWAPLGRVLSIEAVERISVVALVLILFSGGMDIGFAHFKRSAVPIVLLGVPGTFLVAGLMAAAAHFVLGLSWTTAGIIGVALAPTDPAVVFSVMGRREVVGRAGTILEGESGANDPVGIALMLALLALATGAAGSVGGVALELALEMIVGAAVGVAGAALLLPFMRRISLPGEGLYPLRTLGAIGLIYGATSLLHGSGFLAVFVAGIVIGDERAPYKAEIERFHSSLASLAEITVFVAMGLSIDLVALTKAGVWLHGLVLALLLAFVVRPLVIGTMLLPVRITSGERVFLAWSGLKGAVPILLGAFAVLAGVSDSQRVYGIVFLVVAFSVMVQGATMPWVATKLGVPMRVREPEPWDLSIRMRHEPRGVQRYVIGAGAEAEHTAIRDLPIGEDAWISLVIRDGVPAQARGDYVLRSQDELLVLAEAENAPALRLMFEGGHSPGSAGGRGATLPGDDGA
ncbi:cation:proton antiporter [soil metagenome]